MSAAVFLGEYEAGSEEWLAARAGRIGGSEAAATFDPSLSPWESRFSLWLRKSGAIDGLPDKALLQWGRILEPVIIGHWLERHPEHVALGTGTWVHPDLDWCAASPDQMLDFNGVTETLEVKTSPRAPPVVTSPC